MKAGQAVQVTLVGDSEGAERGARERELILQTIAKRGLSHRVRLLGYVSRGELRRQAHLHDVFLAPSITAVDGDSEGGAPVTIIEMSASGMPVVATTHCDIPQVVVDGVTGLLAAERDADGLADRLGCLAADPDLRAAMGAAGRRHVADKFDVRTLVRGLEARYLSLL